MSIFSINASKIESVLEKLLYFLKSLYTKGKMFHVEHFYNP